MSSKNSQGQGRRTPLTLNAQGKSVPQQQMKQQKQQEKKDTVNNVAAASAAGPVPAEKNVSKQQQQQNTNFKNGLNNGAESKATTANSNVNKAAANAESMKEVEIHSKPNEEQQQQQQLKNGGDNAAKASFANNSGNAAQRKQQQKQITPQIQPQLQQQKAQSNKSIEEKTVDEKKEQVAEAVVVVVAAENAKTNDKTPTKKTVAAAAAVTPQKVEDKQEQQTSTKTTGTPTKPIDNADQPAVMPSPVVNKSSPMKKRTVTSVVDVAEMDGGSPQKTADKKTALNENPNATSTPGKLSKPVELNNPMTPIGAGGRTSAISGRPSIRTFNDLTPSKFENYRSPRGELDMSANTSMNVTVGSEPGDNTSWFSLRSRKRERVENVHDELLSPQKRARSSGFFGIMASPFIALRTRFAKASIEQVAYEDQEKNVSMGEEVSMIELEDNTPPASEDVNGQEEEQISEEIKKLTDAEIKLQNDIAKLGRCTIM